MLRSLRSELLKVTTTRIWWILALILFGYVALNAGVIAGFSGAVVGTAEGALEPALLPPLVYSAVTAVGYVFPLLFGALGATSEFRHQTLTPTFLAIPRRGTVLVGKVTSGVLWGGAYGLIGILAAVGVGGAVLAVVGIDPGLGTVDIWALLVRIVLAMALWAAVGIGLGVLLPNQVAVIVIVLAFTQFVEPLLRVASVLGEWTAAVGRFLPGAATDALVGSSILNLALGGAADALEWWQGGLVLGGYAALFLVAGALTTWRRDVT